MNHVALEVGDLEAALAFYAQIFDLEVESEAGFPGMAFIDMGDQFIALSEGREHPPDQARHIGLVVDDKEAVRAALEKAGAEILPTRFLDFRDPWGNRIQVVQYSEIQFTKAAAVLRGMELEHLEKNPAALAELRGKGLA